MATGAVHLCEQVGVFAPKSLPKDQLAAGEVGFIISGIKELKAAKVGDTVTMADRPATEALPGFKEIKPQVFAGLYPIEANQYDGLRESLEKLQLNDASLHYEPEVSQALGFGFRCGFLGLLHMEIVQERLEREFDQDLITTAPTVVYQVLMRDGTELFVENPSKLPETQKVEEIREPIITTEIFVPQDYLGAVITLCDRQARQSDRHALPRPAGARHLRNAAGRSGVRLLRQAQVGIARLRFAGLRVQGVPRRRRRQARRADQRRQGGCPVGDRPSRQRRLSRPGTGGQDARV